MDLGLDGKVALVCGGSKGLGYACAEALVSEGAHVAICARTPAALEKARKRLAGLGGGKVSAHQADVAVDKELERLVDEVVEQHGRVDILVTNSGGPQTGAFEDASETDWQDAYEVVLMQVVRLVRAVAPGMKERGWGRVVNIVSSTYREPMPSMVLSNSFRPAVVGLAKTLSKELAPFGVTVNSVAPGRFDTERLREVAKMRSKKQGGSVDQWMRRFGEDAAAQRVGDPRELGDMVAFLASDQARFVNGVTVPVDGGLLKSL